jgi:hypothetical protein
MSSSDQWLCDDEHDVLRLAVTLAHDMGDLRVGNDPTRADLARWALLAEAVAGWARARLDEYPI